MIEVLIFMVAVAGAGAQSEPRVSTDPKDLVGRLQACGGLIEDKKRLECYDRESASLSKAIADGSLALVTHSQVEKAHREGFGYSVSDRRVGPLVHVAPVAEVKEITSVIKSVRPYTYGRYDLSLADGSVWQNVDLLTTSPMTGEKAQITKTAFGAYLLKVPYSESVHAKRVK